ncbi:ABC transporter permease, partial [Candidatus Hodarchaeum mangrovi]
MTLRNSLAVCGRMGLQIIRSKWTIPYLVIFPIFFMSIYWFGFSASPIGTTPSFQLGIVNNDEGLPEEFQNVFLNETIIGNNTLMLYHSIDVLEKGFGIELIQVLNSTTYTNHTASPNIFDVSIYASISEAEELLIDRDLDILMEIPPGFSNASISIFNKYWKNTFGQYFHEMLQTSFPEVPSLPVNFSETILIQGDETSINFRLAHSVLTSFLENYEDLTSFFEGPGGSISFTLSQEYQISIPQYSLFD